VSTTTAPAASNTFTIALFLAGALHLILLLGLGFGFEPPSPQPPQLAITLAQHRAALTPEEITHLAQFSQAGSGSSAAEDRTGGRSAGAPLQAEAREASEAADASASDSALSARSSREQAAAEREQQREAAPMSAPQPVGLTARLVSEQADMDIDEDQTTLSSAPRVRRLSAVSAQEAMDAAYLHDWRRRVEAVGNQYYPEASIRYGLYGSLQLLVVVNYEGQLEDLRILSSSGYAVLDEAAMKIVRMAAPFAPFPAALRATTDKLEIVRTWQFEENRLSSE
jgi:protein TonB|tara:strand:+ start:11700 stop:12545 length:846 start_codon:yes stop_codon:yes gene_type:complete